MDICICVYIYIPKCNISSLCNVTFMCVFRAEYNNFVLMKKEAVNLKEMGRATFDGLEGRKGREML